jgi:hypothetical protein
MFRVFRADWYERKFSKLSTSEQRRVARFEQELKASPFSGKPLGYSFFRQKKFNGKGLIFPVYDSHQSVF